jgi:hypothetical protein
VTGEQSCYRIDARTTINPPPGSETGKAPDVTGIGPGDDSEGGLGIECVIHQITNMRRL